MRLKPASEAVEASEDAEKTDMPQPAVHMGLAKAAVALGASSVILALGAAFQQGLNAAFAAAGFPAAMLLTQGLLESVFAGSDSAPSALKMWMLSTAAGLGFAAYAYSVAMLSPWAAGASVAAAVLGLVSTLKGSGKGAPVEKAPSTNEFSKDGLLSLARDAKGRLRLTLREADLDKPMMLSAMLEKGVGENFLYSMSPFTEAMVYFHRAGDRIQLVRKNMAFRAKEGTADARVVERSFADSVLASVPIASKDEKAGSVTVGFEGVLLADLFDMENTLGASYPDARGYSLDKELSSVASAKVFPKNAEFSAELLFSNPSPRYDIPVPDARNLGLRLRYSFSALPEAGFQARAADDRVGFFTTVYRDFTDLVSSPAADTPQGRLVNRWRLEKRYPGDKVSPVVKPIVWWMENTVPKEYRDAVREGVLKWNEAFERLGYKDAIVVRQQPDPGAEPADGLEREFDPADVRYNVIHWFTGRDADIAFAQWRTDPRTGEIFNGHVNFSLQVLDGSGYRGMRDVLGHHEESHGHKHGPSCRFGHEVARTLDAVKASGVSEELRRKFTRELIVSYIVHEFGHALGLRHNFAATSLRSLDEISKAKDGIVSQSVMDYAAISIPAEENPGGTYVQTELGPYDYLAIEYGYMPLDGMSAEKAKAELSRVAGRVGEPGLEFATDEQVDGTDPYVNQFDFGPEPLEFAGASIGRARRLIEAMASRKLKEGEDYSSLRRQFRFIFRGQIVRALRLAVPYIGGIRVNRVRAGQNAGKLPYEAVSGEKQREALSFLFENLFSDEAMALPDGLLAKLAPDLRDSLAGDPDPAVLPYEEMVTDVRKWAIDSVLSPDRLKRMAESRGLGETDYFSVRELFASLTLAVWTEIHQKAAKDAFNISPLRRRAQSAHVEHLIGILRGPSGLEEDPNGGGLREPSNPYSSEAVSAASSELQSIGGRIAELLEKAQKAKTPLKADPAAVEHLEHVLWRIQSALH